MRALAELFAERALQDSQTAEAAQLCGVAPPATPLIPGCASPDLTDRGYSFVAATPWPRLRGAVRQRSYLAMTIRL